jgi:hypothetical protein
MTTNRTIITIGEYTLVKGRREYMVIDPTSTNPDHEVPIIGRPLTDAEAVKVFLQFLEGQGVIRPSAQPEEGDDEWYGKGIAHETDADLVRAIMSNQPEEAQCVQPYPGNANVFVVTAGFLLSLMEEAGYGQEGN